MTTCAIIPCYNEAKTVVEVINQVSKYVSHVIVVDDGSTDGSAKNISHYSNITLIVHEKNLGKGAALKRGFQKSIEMGFDITITIDADLQHSPEFIPSFIKKLETCDIVLGNRFHDLKDMPLPRILSNKITSKIISLKIGKEITDSQNGFRGFRNETLQNLIPESKGFEAESEILILGGKNNYKIGTVNIPTIYGNDNSKMKNSKAILGFIKVVFKY